MTGTPRRGALFQEHLRHDPYWMLVACQLVNLTTWEQAESAFLWIRTRCIDAVGLAASRPSELEETLRPLGLWRRRSVILPRFSIAWLLSEPRCYDDVLGLPGCGKYAADSWAIFVEDRLDVEPDDDKLCWYLERMRYAEDVSWRNYSGSRVRRDSPVNVGPTPVSGVQSRI